MTQARPPVQNAPTGFSESTARSLTGRPRLARKGWGANRPTVVGLTLSVLTPKTRKLP
jgi:hypothetical protein